MDVTTAIDEFEQACQSVAQVQEDVLCSILRDNASCSYLQKYGSPLVPAAFKAQVPIISYEDVADDIGKVANGERSSLLCNYPTTCFYLSSGTSSGKHKLIPGTAENISATTRALQISQAHKKICFPERRGRRTFGLFYCMDDFRTKSGIVAGVASTFIIKSEYFKRDRSSRFTTPHEMLVAGSNWRELTYCHLLCALLQRQEVEEIESVFAYTVCEALRMLKSDWQEICSDIKTGNLNSSKQEIVDWNPFVPLPGSESCLRSCDRSHGTVCSGIARLRRRRDLDSWEDYYSSEGVIGININRASPPEKIVYTILPQTLYYEFLALDSPDDETVAAHEVVIGKQYELVITNFAGLYRWRIGDVVTVAGKFHGAPQLAFSHRANVVPSLQNEMVGEEELQNSVMELSKVAGIQVANFTSYSDSSTSPVHCVIFWELENSNVDDKVLEKCCLSLDRSFSPEYKASRINGLVNPLELVIVKQGTFEKLMEEAVKSGSSPQQYKPSRCITSQEMLKAINSGRLASYTSGRMQLESLQRTFEFESQA